MTLRDQTVRQILHASVEWIRTSGEYDAVIDFDATTRDPANPLRFVPAHDSGRSPAPGDAGYRAMGESIGLDLFR